LVEATHAAGVRVLVIHARKAWLDGLSPKENREVPPLRYEVVHALKAAFPGCTVVVNGGITTLEQCRAQLALVDGVMLGREAYYNPWLLQSVDPVLFGESAPVASISGAVDQLLPYLETQFAAGVPLSAVTRHVLGLVQGVPGARQWRRTLSERVHQPGATPALLLEALAHVRGALDAEPPAQRRVA